MEAFDDIKEAVGFFITGLNWTYIIIFALVIYGIKNEEEFEWYKNLTSKTKMGTWIVTIVLSRTSSVAVNSYVNKKFNEINNKKEGEKK